jgi:polysaccharide deacetylase family protein (PEP-CTERM system associated)
MGRIVEPEPPRGPRHPSPTALEAQAPHTAAAASATPAGGPRTHILTVAVEDYFHVTPFKSLIDRHQWYRFETRMEESTRKTLELLDEHQVKATFFVLGWVAEVAPHLVREIAARGHEVASKGFYHRDIHQVDRQEFREDVVRARDALEAATGRRVLGYRVPEGWFNQSDLWALEVLAEAGMLYDSSVRLVLRSYVTQPWRRFPHIEQVLGRPFLEVPLSSVKLCGLNLPIAGGNYFRQFPHILVRRAVKYWDRHYTAPYVMYFHTWELDSQQPRISAAPMTSRIRQYRNLEKMPGMLAYYLRHYRFTTIAEYFGLEQGGARADHQTSASGTPNVAVGLSRSRGRVIPEVGAGQSLPVTVVVPCYNEAPSLGYLAKTLESVSQKLGPDYTLAFVFVDDASTDGTWAALHQHFGADPRIRFVRHEQNRGVAAAIQTGIARAATEVVCSMDCDCTYDPHELFHMIPLLTPGVDVVTASPYHSLGRVRNVPAWRLMLSRSLSGLYRLVLRQQLATYTSCFRVYRRSAVLPIQLQRTGFLGVAELLGRLDLVGAKIVEYPTCLEVRLLGRSKMKVLHTILGHLGVLASLIRLRIAGRGWGRGATAAERATSQPAGS